MAAEFFERNGGESESESKSNTHLLQELETLSQYLYRSHLRGRRTVSLSLPLPRDSQLPSSSSSADHDPADEFKPRPRRMSLSPWRTTSRPNHDDHRDDQEPPTKELKLFDDIFPASAQGNNNYNYYNSKESKKKKGIWNWKPIIRALSHIRMHRLSCLFSVQVVAVRGLPTRMSGLRLSVCVRKDEEEEETNKLDIGSAVHTMPSRVSQLGAADFEETLFIKSHVYCSTLGGGTANQQLKFEPRPFLIYVLPVDTDEVGFGRSSVDLSRLIQESVAKSAQGTRIRQWDTSFNLAGKAKGGKLLLKLGFQIMEKDGRGIGIYNLQVGGKPSSSSPAARKQSMRRTEVLTPSAAGTILAADNNNIQAIDHLNQLDDPPSPDSPPPAVEVQKWNIEPDPRIIGDLEYLPEFEVVDKGIEVQLQHSSSSSSTVEEEVQLTQLMMTVKTRVKEIVQDRFHVTRLTELHSIADQQIEALESSMCMADEISSSRTDETRYSQRLDDEEETVTREFLQMLEDHHDQEEEEETEPQSDQFADGMPPSFVDKPDGLELLEASLGLDGESNINIFLPDLGKGLGSVVQTRNGGYLAAMNPFDAVAPMAMGRKDSTTDPKLAMQMSKPLVLTSYKSKTTTGFELFQRIAAVGLEELISEIASLMPVEEMTGKTAEQVAFEGIASAIITSRKKFEGGATASSCAAQTIAAVRKMATAMSVARREWTTTGIWNLSEDPVTVEEILASAMHKIEAMSIDALKIQAEMSEEDAPPIDVVSPGRILLMTESGKDHSLRHPLASAVPIEDWIRNSTPDDDDDASSTMITMAVVIQLRDPLRRYEAVGGPILALIQATEAADDHTTKTKEEEEEEEKKKFKVASLHIGGIKLVQTGNERNHVWDTEEQKLTATQWLVEYGFGKALRKKVKAPHKAGQEHDLLWSLSSRVIADMWLKTIRNPDVKFIN